MIACGSYKNLAEFLSSGSVLQKCFPSTRPDSPPEAIPWWINLSIVTEGTFKRWLIAFLLTKALVIFPSFFDTRS